MQNIKSKAFIYKALGHPTRLFIIEFLNKNGERCVCELTEILGYDISTISKHLNVLKRAGLVKSRRDGQMIFYESMIPCLNEILTCIDCVSNNLCTNNSKKNNKRK